MAVGKWIVFCPGQSRYDAFWFELEPGMQLPMWEEEQYPKKILILDDPDLFTVLASQPGQVFGREKLMTSVWGYTGYLGDIRLVDVAIRRLRMKIEDDPGNPQFIMTRRGKGYFFAV